MGGNTGNLRTMRISATGGTRTLASMIANGATSGAGSYRRLYGYYANINQVYGFWENLGIKRR
jgi:hypothetical protein